MEDSKNSPWEKPVSFLKKVADAAGEAAKIAKEEYDKSSLKGKVDESTEKAKALLDESGVTEQLKKVSDQTGEQFDKISGAKILQLVEERLEIQKKYNDILATKLEEALSRIKKLENERK